MKSKIIKIHFPEGATFYATGGEESTPSIVVKDIQLIDDGRGVKVDHTNGTIEIIAGFPYRFKTNENKLEIGREDIEAGSLHKVEDAVSGAGER